MATRFHCAGSAKACHETVRSKKGLSLRFFRLKRAVFVEASFTKDRDLSQRKIGIFCTITSH